MVSRGKAARHQIFPMIKKAVDRGPGINTDNSLLHMDYEDFGITPYSTISR